MVQTFFGFPGYESQGVTGLRVIEEKKVRSKKSHCTDPLMTETTKN